jgi:hypothetical protein
MARDKRKTSTERAIPVKTAPALFAPFLGSATTHGQETAAATAAVPRLERSAPQSNRKELANPFPFSIRRTAARAHGRNVGGKRPFLPPLAPYENSWNFRREEAWNHGMASSQRAARRPPPAL